MNINIESLRFTADQKLLDYIEKGHFKISDRWHLLACCKALGRYGSRDSLSFLRKKLLYKGWMPGSIRSLHRQGAVVALTALDVEDAKEILKKASRSLFPSVRHAYRKGMEENQ